MSRGLVTFIGDNRRALGQCILTGSSSAGADRNAHDAVVGVAGAGRPILHDWRAATVDAAIRLHEGEARSARDHYKQLNSNQQQALLDFLTRFERWQYDAII
jgi:di-heme oxidoreductase (putative peroxidase)